MNIKVVMLRAAVEDLVADLLLYDRKDDELSRNDLAALIESGEVTPATIVNWFDEELRQNWPEPKDRSQT